MKKYVFALIMVSATLLMSACKDKNNGAIVDPINNPTNIDQQKDYFDQSVTAILGYFNTAEQKHVIEVADHLAEVFEERDWDFSAAEDFYENNYDYIFRESYYAPQAVAMRASMLANPIYKFSFANDAMTFEANTATGKVVNNGKSQDGKYTIILHDGKTTYTMQAWGEGNNTTYQVNMNEFGGENKVIAGVLPEKIFYVLKENNNELINICAEPTIVKDSKISFKNTFTFTSLSYTMNLNLTAAAMEFGYGIKNNANTLIAVDFDMPSLPTLIKKGNLSYEEWFDMYGEQWESIVQNTKNANFYFNLGDRIQFKGNAKNGGELYTELYDWLEDETSDDKAWWGKLAKVINKHANVNMYFNSDEKQGSIEADVVKIEGEYITMPVVVFADGSSYDLTSYFMNEKVYNDYFRQIDNLLASYEALFSYIDADVRLNY